MAQRAPIERGPRARTGTPARRYEINTMETASHVVWAFHNHLVQDPEYVKAVLRNYVEFKAARGRSKMEIGYKLQPLEEEFPRFAKQFVEVRDEYRLPPSPLIRIARRLTSTGATSAPLSNTNSLRRTQTANPSSPRAANTIARTHTTTGATTNRPVQQDGDEPPPPPYASQDPEPEATRMLQEQLAAEAEATGSGNSAPILAPSITSQPSTPSRPANSSALSPPPSARSQGTPNRLSQDGRPASPPPPNDPEMARVWEESQLVEAQRASLAAQREQEELEEAMRISLAEAESMAQSSTSPRQAQAGSSQPRPPSVNPDIAELTSGMGDLSIPGGWQANASSNYPSHEVPGYDHSPSAANKTNAHLKSKNPFLSATEREYLQAEEMYGESAENPGSSHTQYRPPSGDPVFVPPPGPPPPHLRIPSQSTSQSFPWDEDTLSSTQPPATLQPPLQPQHTPSPQPTATPRGQPPQLPPRRTSYIPPQGEDPLETLKDFDTVFLVDDSTSMAGDRWNQARTALMEVAEIASRYDENGVDVYFLNSKRVGKELKGAHDMEELFAGLEPRGATPTGIRLEAILREYMSRLERSQVASPGSSSIERVKPMNLIVVTDGAPTDDPESVLIACAKRLDRGEFPLSQVGIQFLQIGNDSEAREALQELDDGISEAHGVRDMVDTLPFTGEEMSAGLIIKTLLGGINRRLDRRSTA
ncbi:hypothetical protein CI109_104743 [Kwoniella shandongensis]|uniref:VWFA domain-containing protein n=1 Tax=Kwoniella shandongensis TaxID=1734106 RepID=A0AAJ8LLV5_9TREE